MSERTGRDATPAEVAAAFEGRSPVWVAESMREAVGLAANAARPGDETED